MKFSLVRKISKSFLIIIICCFTYITSSIYKCLTTAPDDSTCVNFDVNQTYPNGTIEYNYLVKGCDPGFYCSTFDIKNNTPQNNSICTPIQRYKFEGENCSLSAECLSGICKNGHCKATKIGETCQYNYQCQNEAFCNENKVCQELIHAGKECNPMYNGCIYGYKCGQNQKNGPYKCLRLFSQKKRKYVSNKIFCRSNQRRKNQSCIETYSEFDEAPTTMTCWKGYCEVRIEDSGDSEDDFGCRYNLKGEDRCPFSSNKTEWDYFIELFNFEVDNYVKGSIHVSEYTKDLRPDNFYNNYNLTLAYMNATAEYNNMDRCVYDFYLAQGLLKNHTFIYKEDNNTKNGGNIICLSVYINIIVILLLI